MTADLGNVDISGRRGRPPTIPTDDHPLLNQHQKTPCATPKTTVLVFVRRPVTEPATLAVKSADQPRLARILSNSDVDMNHAMVAHHCQSRAD